MNSCSGRIFFFFQQTANLEIGPLAAKDDGVVFLGNHIAAEHARRNSNSNVRVEMVANLAESVELICIAMFYKVNLKLCEKSGVNIAFPA